MNKDIYVISRFRVEAGYKNSGELFNDHETCMRAFTNEEDAEKCLKKIKDEIKRLESMMISGDYYEKIEKIKDPIFYLSGTDFDILNQEILDCLVFCTDDFEFAREFVEFCQEGEGEYYDSSVLYWVVDTHLDFKIERIGLDQ